MTTISMRVQPAGLTERIAARVGMSALRWARRRAAERERDVVAGRIAQADALERREQCWAALESRPGR